MEVKQKKQQLRILVKEKMQKMTKEYCRKADQKICANVIGCYEYMQAKTVFCFVGTSNEIDTSKILEHAWSSGKCVAVPKCVQKGVMYAYETKSFDDLKLGKYQILEPKELCKQINIDEIDFGIIPCLSCDAKGFRLGHGGGYYDRYLEHARFKTAVVCREELLLEECPVDIYDRQIDIVITEKRV